MRVIVDHERCHSNANCLDECPEVFALGDDDKPVVLRERPVQELWEKVRFAAACCPRSAIHLREESGEHSSTAAKTSEST